MDGREKAVLVMHMLRVMECIGTYLVIDELAPTYELLLGIFVEAQLLSLSTLMRVNDVFAGNFAGDFVGIRNDLKYMRDSGDYGNFAAVSGRFEGLFGRFCAAAEEDAKRQGKDTTPSSPSASGDPSGYVYEAVPGNRLQGAEVSLYCEDDISQAPLLWDAASYGQEARQVTGADGTFGWDVPDGRWQVRCAMAGYEPYVGEWLDVPPEHTDVGVAMVCREAPRVAGARVRDGEVLLSFSRYMVPESVGGLRLLDAGGAEVPFELEWRAEEGDGGRAYAREYVLRLRAEPQAGPYTLRASGRETSYAGVCMEAGDTAVS